MQVTLVQCYPRLMEEKILKYQMFLCGADGSKSVTRMSEMMIEVVVQHVTEPKNILKNCGIWCIQVDVLSI
jgi:hypothetical protein